MQRFTQRTVDIKLTIDFNRSKQAWYRPAGLRSSRDGNRIQTRLPKFYRLARIQIGSDDYQPFVKLAKIIDAPFSGKSFR